MSETAAKPAVIFGLSDYSRVARVYLDEDSPYEVVAFTVDDEYVPDPAELAGLPVLPFSELTERHPPGEVAMLVAVAYSRVNQTRREIFERCKELGYEFVSYVCSRATTMSDLSVGENTFIFENNVIQPFVKIGDNCVLWSGNHIGHDTTINDHCFIASHAVISGNVKIGHSCFVGVNATFRDAITVAPRCIIGAGALIMRDTVEGGIYSVRGTEASERKSWELENF